VGEKIRKPSRGQLLDAAFRTAVDHVGYSKYESETGALKSLRRRCRGFTPMQYRNALLRAIELLGNVKEVIAPFDPPYDAVIPDGGWSGFEGAARELQRRSPGFRISTCKSAIWWTLFWYHWK
jgi:hypothetical protein